MKFEVYSIRDIFVGFGPVVCEQNVNTAVRNFKTLSSSPDLPFCDFELYRVGYYDTKTGILCSLPAPDLICRGSDFSDASTDTKEVLSDEIGQSE